MLRVTTSGPSKRGIVSRGNKALLVVDTSSLQRLITAIFASLPNMLAPELRQRITLVVVRRIRSNSYPYFVRVRNVAKASPCVGDKLTVDYRSDTIITAWIEILEEKLSSKTKREKRSIAHFLKPFLTMGSSIQRKRTVDRIYSDWANFRISSINAAAQLERLQNAT